MMKAVIPVLREVIGNADDEEAPPERHPRKHILVARQEKGQDLQPEVRDKRPYNQ